MEAVVDASGIGVFSQLGVPVCLYRHTLEQGTEKDGNRMKDRGNNQPPDDPEDGLVVSLQT